MFLFLCPLGFVRDVVGCLVLLDWTCHLLVSGELLFSIIHYQIASSYVYFLGMVFLRILGTRSTHNFFDDETGLLYSHDTGSNTHKCVHASFMKFLNFPPREWKAVQCEVVYETGDDHCHLPLERRYIERMMLLWQAYLDVLAYPRFLNGSCAFWTACRVPKKTKT